MAVMISLLILIVLLLLLLIWREVQWRTLFTDDPSSISCEDEHGLRDYCAPPCSEEGGSAHLRAFLHSKRVEGVLPSSQSPILFKE